LVHALPGATVLGKPMLRRVAFLERVSTTHCDRRRADDSPDRGAALRTVRQFGFTEFLPCVEMRLAVGATFARSSVFVNRHGVDIASVLGATQEWKDWRLSSCRFALSAVLRRFRLAGPVRQRRRLGFATTPTSPSSG